MTYMIKENCQIKTYSVFDGAVSAYRETDEQACLEDSL